MMRQALNWSASGGPAQRLLGFGFSGWVRPFWVFFLSSRSFCDFFLPSQLSWAFFLSPRLFWAFFFSPGRPGSGTLPDCNPLKPHPDNCLFLSCLSLLSCLCLLSCPCLCLCLLSFLCFRAFRAFRGVAFLLPMQRRRKLA